MKRCEALKGDGSRCRARAMEGSQWCYNHDPSKAEERQRNARRGGRAGGRGRPSSGVAEIETAKRYAKELISQLLKGEVDRGVAHSAFAGLHVLARLLELERKIRETDELEARLEILERRARVEGQHTFQYRR